MLYHLTVRLSRGMCINPENNLASSSEFEITWWKEGENASDSGLLKERRPGVKVWRPGATSVTGPHGLGRHPGGPERSIPPMALGGIEKVR